MKKTILFSILALCFSAALLSADVPAGGSVAQKDAFALRTPDERKVIARGLYGRIEIVKSSSAADYRVFITNISSAADLRVAIVNTNATSPGKWEIVDAAPDFRVYITNSSSEADIQIEFTNHFPGPRCEAR